MARYMFQDWPVPSNTIRLDKIKYVERPIEGLLHCSPEMGHDPTSRLIMASSLDRFCCVPDGCVISILDTFIGNLKTLVPKMSNEVSKISACVYLSQNRGFLVYETPYRPLQFSIISIDIENGVYEFIGSPQTFSGHWCTCCDFRDLVVVIKTISSENNLQIFTIDPSSFYFKSHEIMTAPDGCCLFGSMNGKLVFANALSYTGFSQHFGNFMMFESKRGFMEIKNTSVKVEIPEIESASSYSSSFSVQGYWHENKVFALFTCSFSKCLTDDCLHPLMITSTMLLFEFETKTWSKIHMDLPSNRIYYHFHIDDNVVLNLVTFAKVDEKVDETSELCAASIRIPLNKPDKLLTLCWFEACDCGLPNKFTYLKTLI